MAASVNREPESEREMVVSRTIAAQRQLVFRAFTEARHLARWFGPNGFTVTRHAFAFPVDGVWDFTMHGPDGTNYPNWICWQVIKPPERLVYEQGTRADDPQAFQAMITFIERNGQTEITLRGLFKTKARLEEVIRVFNALSGARETLGRLDAYTGELTQTAQAEN